MADCLQCFFGEYRRKSKLYRSALTVIFILFLVAGLLFTSAYAEETEQKTETSIQSGSAPLTTAGNETDSKGDATGGDTENSFVPDGSASLESIKTDGSAIAKPEDSSFANDPVTQEQADDAEYADADESKLKDDASETEDDKQEGEGEKTQKDETASESTDSLNAIQKAVNAAIESINKNEGSAEKDFEIYINVKAGDYYGDVTIDKGKISASNCGRLTVILAAEGESIDNPDTESDGSVRLNGDVYIKNADVTFIGLYLSIKSLIEAESSRVDIYGTTGDDTVNVVLDGNSTADIKTGQGNDSVSISARSEKETGQSSGDKTSDARGDSKISTGSGDDRVSVDIGIARGSASVSVDTGEGTDSVELTGKLSTSAPEGRQRASYISSEDTRLFTFIAEKGDELSVAVEGAEKILETLENKERVLVTDGAEARKELVDYVLELDSVKELVVNTAVGLISGSQLYANLLLKASKSVTVLGNIDAGNLNVRILAPVIVISGNISARNIYITAYNADKLEGLEEKAKEMGLPDGIVAQSDAKADLFDATATAGVTVNKSSHIEATEDVAITAQTLMTRPFVLDKACNFVSVKISNAYINVYGTVEGNTVR